MTDQLNREGVKAIAHALQGRDEAAAAAHTPGPWEMAIDLRGGIQRIRTDERNIADVFLSIGIPETEANALLIVAAPDLIAALKKIEEGRGAFSRDHLTHCENTVEDMRTIARDAITAATGEDYPDTLRATEEG